MRVGYRLRAGRVLPPGILRAGCAGATLQRCGMRCGLPGMDAGLRLRLLHLPERGVLCGLHRTRLGITAPDPPDEQAPHAAVRRAKTTVNPAARCSRLRALAHRRWRTPPASTFP